jgi:hypothetical protein
MMGKITAYLGAFPCFADPKFPIQTVNTAFQGTDVTVFKMFGGKLDPLRQVSLL